MLNNCAVQSLKVFRVPVFHHPYILHCSAVLKCVIMGVIVSICAVFVLYDQDMYCTNFEQPCFGVFIYYSELLELLYINKININNLSSAFTQSAPVPFVVKM